jgi:hypothetical protein
MMKKWLKDANFQKATESESELIYNMSAEEFQALRTNLTVDDGLNKLDEIRINLATLFTADCSQPTT